MNIVGIVNDLYVVQLTEAELTLVKALFGERPVKEQVKNHYDRPRMRNIKHDRRTGKKVKKSEYRDRDPLGPEAHKVLGTCLGKNTPGVNMGALITEIIPREKMRYYIALKDAQEASGLSYHQFRRAIVNKRLKAFYSEGRITVVKIADANLIVSELINLGNHHLNLIPGG